jgi:hypothetical protein
MKEWKYLIHFLYVFFMSIYFTNYIYAQEKFNIIKKENKRMLINTNLMKEGTMQVPS